MEDTTRTDRSHWQRQLRLTFILLAIWFLVGPVMSILLVERMNEMSISGIPFGFWMAQQGSIYVFVLLIFVYAWLSDRNDRAANGGGAGAAREGGGGPGAPAAPATPAGGGAAGAARRPAHEGVAGTARFPSNGSTPHPGTDRR